MNEVPELCQLRSFAIAQDDNAFAQDDNAFLRMTMLLLRMTMLLLRMTMLLLRMTIVAVFIKPDFSVVSMVFLIPFSSNNLTKFDNTKNVPGADLF
jgi:hypothetical protein